MTRRADWINISFIAIGHILAVAAVLWLSLVQANPWTIGLGVVWFVLCGLAITGGYHRLFSHPTYKAHWSVRLFYLLFGAAGVQNSALKWCADHRVHHGRVDQEEDPYNIRRGFWWAHIRWLYQSEPADEKRWCPEFTRGIYKFWTNSEVWIIAASIFSGLIFGWEGFFWVGAARLVYCLHMQCFVNSLTHLGHEHDDTSQNVWWLGPLQLGAWGENWHRNHHTNAASARLGLKWYQIDVGWYFIWTLERFGLAYRVLRPKSAH